MSLRAKLEAVIYAAEEPVTLTQLASLFAAEAFEYKAEKEAAAREAEEAAAAESPRPLVDQGLEYLGLEQTPELYAETAASDAAAEAGEAEGPTAVESAPEAPAEQEGEAPPAEAQADGAGDNAAEGETDAKKLARQRDREVKAILRGILDEIIASYEADERGVEIREIAGGYRMATKPECHDAVRLFIKSLKPPMKLSLPALETLAVIAYKQPVTAPEVNEIRGVESAGVLGSLLTRKLITTAGRKQVVGRPILYKTTKEFLLRFGLKDVSELPSMEEFEKIAAIELSEPGTEADEDNEDVGGPGPGGGPELDEDAPENDSVPSGELAVPAAAESTEASGSETLESTAAEAAPAEPAALNQQAETEN